MAYSAEVVRRARERLEQQRADRESEYRAHLAEAYREQPRLREIDRLLRQTMAQAAQCAFLKGEEGTALMAKAREANLALQTERRELVNTFPEGYLNDRPVCDKCGGTGYIGSRMCTCLEDLCCQEQRRELAGMGIRAEDFRDFRLDYYSEQIDRTYGASPRIIMERNLERCRRFVRDFGGKPENLLFIGNTGLGKTFLSACIAGSVSQRGFSVSYESAAHLFSKLERERFSPCEENKQAAEAIRNADLLILDDLGTEMPGQFVTAALYTLVNDRLMEGKPMIISTNLNIGEVAQRYNPQIASRLQGSFTRLTFVGEDIRLIMSREGRR